MNLGNDNLKPGNSNPGYINPGTAENLIVVYGDQFDNKFRHHTKMNYLRSIKVHLKFELLQSMYVDSNLPLRKCRKNSEHAGPRPFSSHTSKKTVCFSFSFLSSIIF